MPSLRSRLFVFMLKHRHLLRGQLKRRAMVDWNTSMPELRREVEKGAGFFGKLPYNITLSPVSIGGLPAEWMLPDGAARDRVMLYFHGGGGDETLLSDSTRFADKAKDVDVTLKVGEGLFHSYPACAPLFPEATEALGEICGFIRKHAGK